MRRGKGECIEVLVLKRYLDEIYGLLNHVLANVDRELHCIGHLRSRPSRQSESSTQMLGQSGVFLLCLLKPPEYTPPLVSIRQIPNALHRPINLQFVPINLPEGTLLMPAGHHFTLLHQAIHSRLRISLHG